MSIESVLRQNFSPLRDYHIPSYLNVFWIQLNIRSNLEFTSQWRLTLFDDWCEEVEVYSKSEAAGEWQIQHAGYTLPIYEIDQHLRLQQTIPKAPNAITLIFAPQEQKKIYIRFIL